MNKRKNEEYWRLKLKVKERRHKKVKRNGKKGYTGPQFFGRKYLG